MDVGINDVDTVFVGECGVGSFPGCDTPSTGTQLDICVGDPGGAESVEEIGFPGYDAVFDVGVAELANVYLLGIRFMRVDFGGRGSTVSW